MGGGKEEGGSDLCCYSGYLCNREKLKSYDFCLRHILEDKTAPFKQCSYNIKSQKRCLRPAPRADKKDGYCAEHARKTLMNRHKLLAKKGHLELYTRCLEDLTHYEGADVLKDCSPPPAKVLRWDGKEEKGGKKVFEECVRKSINPHELLSKVRHVSCVVEGGEELSDEEDDVRVDQAWEGDGDSDAESMDSDLDNPLRHAGVYAAEEVVRIMRDKLMRLRKNYIDQFQRLQYLLREERRRYKHSIQKEKETLMSIHKQPKDSEAERTSYRLIKSLNHYNLRQGKDAIFATKVKEKRLKASEGGSSKDHVHKCTFHITSHMKCSEPCIPLSKFCLKHIFQDTSQILFRRCGFITPADDEPCETPVPNTFDESTCVYHAYLPPLYSKQESFNCNHTNSRKEQSLPSVKVKVEPLSVQEDIEPENNPATQLLIEDQKAIEPIIPREIMEITPASESSSKRVLEILDSVTLGMETRDSSSEKPLNPL